MQPCFSAILCCEMEGKLLLLMAKPEEIRKVNPIQHCKGQEAPFLIVNAGPS